MKNSRPLFGPPVLALLVTLFACGPTEIPTCRIAKFLWEDNWYSAVYDPAGRLTSLEAIGRRVDFSYLSGKLTKAAIYEDGLAPRFMFTFKHGPYGIIEANEYHESIFGTEHNRTLYHYASPSQIDYIVCQEFGTGGDPDPGFEIRYNFSYDRNGNLSEADGRSSWLSSRYLGLEYDKKANPYRMLAAATGNPLFFPACLSANFPGPDYGISILSIFSSNNPVRGEYLIPGVDPEVQRFINSYSGQLTTKIIWANTSYGTTTEQDYAFEYDCVALRSYE
ncbi:MAG: hypothetical protein ACOYXT_25750 [Bacteroidota bacterium]